MPQVNEFSWLILSFKMTFFLMLVSIFFMMPLMLLILPKSFIIPKKKFSYMF